MRNAGHARDGEPHPFRRQFLLPDRSEEEVGDLGDDSPATFRRCRLDHLCFEAEKWDDIRDWADHLVAADTEIIWGPGRHGPGNNLFLFFKDPDGNWLEVSAELETKTPGDPPGIWKHEPRTLNLWGDAVMRS